MQHPSIVGDEMVTVLMMTHVLSTLPAALHHACICATGSKGYTATKEMLQNGTPGHTLLLESGDLRDFEPQGEVHSLLNYCCPANSCFLYRDHIPAAVRHIEVYANISTVPRDFLNGCTGLSTIGLARSLW